MTYQYLTREVFKGEIKVDDTYDDLAIDRALVAATSVIDSATGRRFQPYLATRPFEAPRCDSRNERIFLHSDLLEVTTLKTDDGTRTYPYTWAGGTWDLGPEDAPYKSPPQPYYWIERVGSLATSVYGWPHGVSRGIQIDGKWGYYDQRSPSGATVDGALDDSTLTIPVSSVTPFEVGHTILIGAEQLYVTAKAADSLTVEERGANGTVAAAHGDGDGIQIYRYPVIDQACMILVSRYLRRTKDAPFGIVGGMDGFMRLAINDPDVAGLISGIGLTAMR